MYEITPVDGRLFAVKTTTRTYFVHVVLGNVASKTALMLELCRAIVHIEREGAIVTSVQQVTADGHRPRVSYRQSREYKQAKSEPQADVVSATYVTYWSSGAVFRAPCKVDTETRRVFDIVPVGHPSDDDELICENVEMDDAEFAVLDIDEILTLEEEENALRQLSDAKETRSCWYSRTGKLLDEVLAQLQAQED